MKLLLEVLKLGLLVYAISVSIIIRLLFSVLIIEYF